MQTLISFALIILLAPWASAELRFQSVDPEDLDLVREKYKGISFVKVWDTSFQGGGISGPESEEIVSNSYNFAGTVEETAEHEWTHPELIEVNLGTVGDLVSTAGSGSTTTIQPDKGFNAIFVVVYSEATDDATTFESGSINELGLPNMSASSSPIASVSDIIVIFDSNGGLFTEFALRGSFDFDDFFGFGHNAHIKFVGANVPANIIVPDPAEMPEPGILLLLLISSGLFLRRKR
jgi:hypothetical protein